MKYGNVQGWNQFKFIVTPDEMEQLLTGLYHVNFQSRVPVDYVKSAPEDFLNHYRKLYEKLASGYQFQWERDYTYFDVHTGLSDDLGKCTYGEPFEIEGNFYKLSDFEEPCVGLGPFALILEGGKLWANYSYLMLPEYTVGIVLQYPKKLSYYSTDREPQAVSCNDIQTYAVYEMLVKEIKAITKALQFKDSHKTYRSGSIRISEQAKIDFQKFYFCNHYGVTL